MNTHPLRAILYLLIIAGILLSSCEHSEKDFVVISGNQLEYKEEPYFPLTVNYVLQMRQIDGKYCLAPTLEYEEVDKYESETLSELRVETRGHLQIMKDMGFNSVRLCMDRIKIDEEGWYYPVDSAYHSKKLYLSQSADTILHAFTEYVELVNEMDLKLIWLLKPPVEDATLWDFSVKLLRQFRNEPAIFAYDFFNEPLYFDRERDGWKDNVFDVVSSWRRMMDLYAPNQLLTIGLSEPIEVFRWDASILPVDFIAFHTYNPLRVPNEIYWYSKYINKPWMVGETGLPADGDSISYDTQLHFNRAAYKQVKDCGGLGMAFWEFQDIESSNFEGKYTGLINRTGSTTSSDGAYTMKGTIKPAGHDIRNLLNYEGGGECKPAVNYFNMMGYRNYIIRGKIINEKTSEPIEGAVIRGWNHYWQVGQNTFSDEKGEFELHSNDQCVHFEISAPGMRLIKFDTVLTYQSISGMRVRKPLLPERTLEYHNISFTDFLTDSVPGQADTMGTYLFTFDTAMFGHAQVAGEMGSINLRPVYTRMSPWQKLR
jgi:hypothetical protein